jgi:hypothetical protein
MTLRSRAESVLFIVHSPSTRQLTIVAGLPRRRIIAGVRRAVFDMRQFARVAAA